MEGKISISSRRKLLSHPFFMIANTAIFLILRPLSSLLLTCLHLPFDAIVILFLDKSITTNCLLDFSLSLSLHSSSVVAPRVMTTGNGIFISTVPRRLAPSAVYPSLVVACQLTHSADSRLV